MAKQFKCKDCATVITVRDESRVTCSGCNRSYSFKKKSTGQRPVVASPCPACGSAMKVTGDGEKSICIQCGEVMILTRKRRKSTRATRAVSAVPQDKSSLAKIACLACFGAGAALMLLSLLIHIAGPFDETLRRKALSDIATTKEAIASYNKEINRATNELSSARDAMKTPREFLRRYPGEMEALDYRLKFVKDKQAKYVDELKESKEKVSAGRVGLRDLYGNIQGETDTVKIIARAEKSVVVIITSKSSGSGFLFSPEGLVVTNYHVLEGGSDIRVHLQKRDSREKLKLTDIKVVAVDADRDIAFLQLPPPPAEIAVKGKYPFSALRASPVVRAGEKVFAIGNPGMGKSILDYTVTRGIVSNARRMFGKVPLIQTSAAVNSGNSGGPLFDERGYIIGMITLKGVAVEAVAFAIPTATINDAHQRRGTEPFAVTSTLAKWESKYRPEVALARKQHAMSTEGAIKLEAPLTGMQLSYDGKVIYLVMGSKGILQEFDYRNNKLKRKLQMDVEISNLTVPEKSSKPLCIFSGSAQSLNMVDSRTLELTETTSLQVPTHLLRQVRIYYGRESLALYSYATPESPTHFRIARLDGFGKNYANTGRLLLDYPKSALFINNAKWLVRLCARGEENNRILSLRSLRLDQFLSLTRDSERAGRKLEELRDKYSKRGDAEKTRRKLTLLDNQLANIEKGNSISLSVLLGDGPLYLGMRFIDDNSIILGKRIYDLDEKKGPSLNRKFPDSPETTRAAKEKANILPFYRYLDNIVSISPDGKFAASGMYVYSVRTLKPLKKLPFPCMLHTFSKDGSMLILYNAAKQSICAFDTKKTAGKK